MRGSLILFNSSQLFILIKDGGVTLPTPKDKLDLVVVAFQPVPEQLEEWKHFPEPPSLLEAAHCDVHVGQLVWVCCFPFETTGKKGEHGALERWSVSQLENFSEFAGIWQYEWGEGMGGSSGSLPAIITDEGASFF